MDWSDIYESANEENIAHILSSLIPLSPPPPPPSPPHVEWSFEENKVLEDAISVYGLGTKPFYGHLSQTLSGKSNQDIRKKCMSLINDTIMPADPMNNVINPMIPDPAISTDNNQGFVNERDDDLDLVTVQENEERVMVQNHGHERGRQAGRVQRRRAVPWTQMEHQVFLMGLNKFGRGDWKSISRYTILRKSPSQVASHAQKYFRRRTIATPIERRRKSIHDIQSPTILAPPMGANNYYNHASAIDTTTAMINNLTITAPTFNATVAAAHHVDSAMLVDMDMDKLMNMNSHSSTSSVPGSSSSGAGSSSSGAGSSSSGAGSSSSSSSSPYNPFGDSLPN